MKRSKLIEEIKLLIEWEHYSYEDITEKWYFDKWEQSDCEAKGFSEGKSEGYVTALKEVLNLLK